MDKENKLQQQIDDINNKLSNFGLDSNAGIIDTRSIQYYGTNNFSGLAFQQATNNVRTTDATVTPIQILNIPDEAITLVEAHVIAQRISGGSAGDGAGYVRRGTYKRTGGAAPVLIGAVQDGYTAESVAGYDCSLDVSGNTVRVIVTGVAATGIIWHSTIKTKQLII